MSRTPRRSLNPESSLVVTYLGTDPCFHRRDERGPNRPACNPDGPPGVLMPLMGAQDSGLLPCPTCWDEDPNE